MKKIIIALALGIFFASGLLGATATIVKVKGTVNVRRSAGSPWIMARVGMTISKGGSISSGFAAAALVKIKPSGSVVRVDQFTTMRFSQLASSGSQVRTTLKLQIGSVRAVVKSTARMRSKFRISTPVATASVRGTIPDVSHYPDTGTTITYIRGFGTVQSLRGRLQLLSLGQQSRVNNQGGATTPFDEAHRPYGIGTIGFNLTPAERDALFRNVSARIYSAESGIRDRLRRFKKQLKLKDQAFDPSIQ